MIRSNGVQPRAERAAGVILRKFLPNFDENIHGGVFGVLASGHRPAAKTKNRRRVLAIEFAPGLRVAGLGLGDPLLGDGLFRGAHPLGMSPRIHHVVRADGVKYFMGETLRADRASDCIPAGSSPRRQPAPGGGWEHCIRLEVMRGKGLQVYTLSPGIPGRNQDSAKIEWSLRNSSRMRGRLRTRNGRNHVEECSRA